MSQFLIVSILLHILTDASPWRIAAAIFVLAFLWDIFRRLTEASITGPVKRASRRFGWGWPTILGRSLPRERR